MGIDSRAGYILQGCIIIKINNYCYCIIIVFTIIAICSYICIDQSLVFMNTTSQKEENVVVHVMYLICLRCVCTYIIILCNVVLCTGSFYKMYCF